MSKALKTLSTQLCFAASLLLTVPAAFANTTSPLITVGSISTDGSQSNSAFRLSIDSEQTESELTTQSDIQLYVDVVPQQAHRDTVASIYAVVIAGGQYFKLNEEGAYQPWDGSMEDLTPFANDQRLTSTSRYTLLDGRLSDVGSYSYFVAYKVQGESTLHYTPDPAQFSVAEFSGLLDQSDSVAANTFEAEVESQIVQAKCIFCHAEGGSARNSSLQFQRDNTASALNNFATLSAFIEEKGSELLLSKASGSVSHTGGVQLDQNSDEYRALQKVVDQINAQDEPAYYTFSGSANTATPRQVSFFTEVVLEPRDLTLRRATLLMQSRLPTDEERNSVDSDASLRIALRRLMQGPNFRKFVVTSVNDRLLTEGTDNPLNTAYNHFLKLHNLKARENLADTNSQIEWKIREYLTRASGELVAHVIENELPYSEILTADYMMMNKTMNTWMEGTASFSADEGDDIFKPSVVQGYYYGNDLELVEFHENSNSIYRAVGEPLKEFPHAGLLTDFGFISRYPTTATNRNRARARWTFYHFLGIDIEKSSQRPTDEASLSDRNNPTMNNPNCTVCHALLDPVAGAFQNWDESNFYRGSGNGADALDGFYKYPPDGSDSPYQEGDLWYRDMRAPGLFDTKITERDTTLRALGELIADEPLFLTASAAFWWSPVFGKPLLDRPAVETDNGYAAKLAAYSAQQKEIERLAEYLEQGMNAKDMLVEMFMSPWFSSESVSGSSYDSAHLESKLGSDQLLTPKQFANKTRALTGVAWRSGRSPDGELWSEIEQLSVLLGGIDSEAVTQRAIELTPTMTSILLTAATESACIAVAREFAQPAANRRLLDLVEATTLPLLEAQISQPVESQAYEDWKTVSLTASLAPGAKTVKIEFLNPYCDFDGQNCVEQRKLYVDSLSVTAPSGMRGIVRGNDPRLKSSYGGPNPDCYNHGDKHRLCFNGHLSLDFQAAEAGEYTVRAIVSAEQTPIRGGLVEMGLSINAKENLLSANTENSRAIREQISLLFNKLHGTSRNPDSEEVTTVYEIFAAALETEQASDGSAWEFENCSTWRDGFIWDDLLSEEEIATFREPHPEFNYFLTDWNILGPIQGKILADPFSSKYAWTAVMMYMLSHYDYLHE